MHAVGWDEPGSRTACCRGNLIFMFGLYAAKHARSFALIHSVFRGSFNEFCRGEYVLAVYRVFFSRGIQLYSNFWHVLTSEAMVIAPDFGAASVSSS
jgi:hypothetical protein